MRRYRKENKNENMRSRLGKLHFFSIIQKCRIFRQKSGMSSRSWRTWFLKKTMTATHIWIAQGWLTPSKEVHVSMRVVIWRWAFVSHASPGGDELLVFHPSAMVGLMEIYGTGLLCNSRRLLKAWTTRKWATKMQPPTKLSPARSTQWGQVDDGRLWPNYELEQLWPAPWLAGRL